MSVVGIASHSLEYEHLAAESHETFLRDGPVACVLGSVCVEAPHAPSALSARQSLPLVGDRSRDFEILPGRNPFDRFILLSSWGRRVPVGEGRGRDSFGSEERGDVRKEVFLHALEVDAQRGGVLDNRVEDERLVGPASSRAKRSSRRGQKARPAMTTWGKAPAVDLFPTSPRRRDSASGRSSHRQRWRAGTKWTPMILGIPREGSA